MLPSTLRSSQTRSHNLYRCLKSAQCYSYGSRAISTNSAIARALRQESYAGGKTRPLFRKELAEYDYKRDTLGAQQRNEKYRARKEREMEEAKSRSAGKRGADTTEREADTTEHDADSTEHDSDSTDFKPIARRRPRGDIDRPRVNDPVAVPHTTAASQFIYGFSSVKAALVSNRRKLYKLYIHDRAYSRAKQGVKADTDPSVKEDAGADQTLDDLATRNSNLEVKHVDDDFLRVMDKMSDGRPHNGCILEASPLPATPVQFLRPATRGRPHFQFEPDVQTREEKKINGTDNNLSYNSHGWRFPLILYLDGIVDTGNVGAIIRSAYYFGVDAIAISKRATAPLDAVTIKASSGAAEAMPILTVRNPLEFLSRSSINGWRIYAADALPPPVDNFNVTKDHFRFALDPQNTSPLISFSRPHTRAVLHEHTPLLAHPTILMFGGESKGFTRSIRAKANYLVGIRGTKGLDLGIDSLNVSVAAGLIMLELLRKPMITKRASEILRKPRVRETGDDLDDKVEHSELLF